MATTILGIPMTFKKVFYNSVTVNLPKNIFQLLLGAILYVAVFGTINPFQLVLAIIGLSLSYSSVYMFNDIMDREEDAMDPEKRGWKLIANGSLKVEGAISVYALLLMSGLLISFVANTLFGFMMVALLFLNFLHSAPGIRLKKKKLPTVINITLIEFIKYSSGWFALTSNVSKFPLWLVLMFAVIYTAGYMAYKFRFDGRTIKGNKPLFAFLGILVLLFYIGSLFYYGFPLALIISLVLSFVVFGLKYAFWHHEKGFNQMLLLELIILPLIIISFLLLAVPSFGAANSALADFLKTLIAV